MTKSILVFSLLSVITLSYSCKSSKKQDDKKAQASSQADSAQSNTAVAATGTKTYAVTATPDSAFLGKKKEALIRLKDMKAIDLSDPDGKITGMELTYKIELTNKNAIGGNNIGISTNNFRLVLDNGNKIAPSSVFVAADANETKLSDEDKFEIPAGAKPVSLNLFYDQTNAAVKLDLK